MDVGVDGVWRDRDTEWPRLVEELVAGQRLAGVAQEALEKRELAGAEVDGLAVDRDAAQRLVERDRAGDELRIRPPRTRRASRQRAESGRQLLECERLHEIVVGPRVKTVHAVADGVPRGEHQDRLLAPALADAAGDLQARDVGQTDVEDDRFDTAAVLDNPQRPLPVLGGRGGKGIFPEPGVEGAGQTGSGFGGE